MAKKIEVFTVKAAGDFPALPDLKKECIRLFSIANNRMDRITNSGVGPMYFHEDKFYVGGLDMDELYSEYVRCVNFLNSAESTLKQVVKK